MATENQCPRCGSTRLKRRGWPSLESWHWLLNPVLVLNELLLGQRAPARVFVCRDCDVPLYRRAWVHCPSCDTMHDGRMWTGWHSFGHWRGPVCPDCGDRIRCLRNLTSLVLIVVTAPIGWPLLQVFRPRLDARARDRAGRAKATLATRQAKDPNWILMGAIFFVGSWGFFMAFIAVRGTLTVDDVIVAGGLWFLGAVLWTLLMYRILNRRGRLQRSE